MNLMQPKYFSLPLIQTFLWRHHMVLIRNKVNKLFRKLVTFQHISIAILHVTSAGTKQG